MNITLISRRVALEKVVFGAAIAAALPAFGQDYDRARDLVSRVMADLNHAADYTRNNGKERERYENVQRHLSEFDRDLRHGNFDKGKLDSAIDNLKDVVKNNTLGPQERDMLASDLSDLRTLRDMR